MCDQCDYEIKAAVRGCPSHHFRKSFTGEHEDYGEYEIWMELNPRQAGCSPNYPYVIVLNNRMFGYYDSYEVYTFKQGGLIPMTVTIQTVLSDDSLAELQKKLGTTEANVPSQLSPESAFIDNSKSIKSLPGYNQVEVVLPLNGEALLRGLGYLPK